ncbi:MAG: hypothetical protein OEV44_12220, partial [Spirochaetota bacterium]|nr:hypothetical protein [Spirochaetota bacterium]
MGFYSHNSTLFQQALNQLKELITELPMNNPIIFEELASEPTIPVKLIKEKDKLIKHIDKIKLQNINTSIFTRIENIFKEITRENLIIGRIFIISDFQKSDWKDIQKHDLVIPKIISNIQFENYIIKKIRDNDKLRLILYNYQYQVPSKIKIRDFERYILKKIKVEKDKTEILTFYYKDNNRNFYYLKNDLKENEKIKITTILKSIEYKNNYLLINNVSENTKLKLLNILNSINYPLISVVMVKIGDVHPSNLAITRVEASSDVQFININENLFVKIKNYGSKFEDKKYLEIFLDGKLKSEKEIMLEAGEEKEYAFKIKDLTDKLLFGEVRIIGDSYSYDNNESFSLYFKKKLDILFLNYSDYPLTNYSIMQSLYSKITNRFHSIRFAEKIDSDNYDFIICNRLGKLKLDEIRIIKSHIDRGVAVLCILNQSDEIFNIRKSLKKINLINEISIVQHKILKKSKLTISTSKFEPNSSFNKLALSISPSLYFNSYYKINYNTNIYNSILKIGLDDLLIQSSLPERNIYLFTAGFNEQNSNIIFDQWFPLLMNWILNDGICKKLNQESVIIPQKVDFIIFQDKILNKVKDKNHIKTLLNCYLANKEKTFYIIKANLDNKDKKKIVEIIKAVNYHVNPYFIESYTKESNLLSYSVKELEYLIKPSKAVNNIKDWFKQQSENKLESFIYKNSILEQLFFIVIILVLFMEMVISYPIGFKPSLKSLIFWK